MGMSLKRHHVLEGTASGHLFHAFDSCLEPRWVFHELIVDAASSFICAPLSQHICGWPFQHRQVTKHAFGNHPVPHAVWMVQGEMVEHLHGTELYVYLENVSFSRYSSVLRRMVNSPFLFLTTAMHLHIRSTFLSFIRFLLFPNHCRDTLTNLISCYNNYCSTSSTLLWRRSLIVHKPQQRWNSSGALWCITTSQTRTNNDDTTY